MTRYQGVAARFRWVLLVLWILCLLAGIGWMFWPVLTDGEQGAGLAGTPALAISGYLYFLLQKLEGLGEYSGYYVAVFFYLALFLGTQWLFLGSHHLWKPQMKEKGIPLKRAAVGAGFCAALISVGLVYSLADLSGDLLNRLVSEDPPAPTDIPRHLFLLIPLLLWIFWAVLFALYLRRSDSLTRLSKLIRGLIAGSLLELFVSIPVYATRQEECYCARGSYAGLVLGTTALLWAFGPGIILLFIREKHRRGELLDAKPAGQSPEVSL